MIKPNEIKQSEAIYRKERIDSLGSFGMKKEQIVKDKIVYTRKTKHKPNNICFC